MLGLLLAAPPARAETPVDLELVLAVDASGSVDDGEYALQLGGIAAAFRDPAVVEAARSGPLRRVAVMLAIWAEANRPKAASAWYMIDGEDSAAAFAAMADAFPRRIPAGGTGIGKAVMFALHALQQNAYVAGRRTIDISGDGRETAFREFSVPISQARHAASANRVTINGLAILAEEADLADYYAANVISGPEAFVMTATDFADFAAAMRRKLLRELEYRPNVAARGAEPAGE